MKTHKGIKKRVRVTAKGKIRFKRANSRHLMSTKSAKRARRLRKPGVLKGPMAQRLLLAVREA
jgi:large subunit ribosomal protein L35